MQHTLKSPISASGVGLHGGQRVTMRLKPSPQDTGISFVRTDLSPPARLAASAFMVGDTRLCSCLEQEGVKVGTIEHVMSALTGMGIDNAEIELDAPEVPILDGSAAPFAFLISQAGIAAQNAPRRFIKVKEPVEVRDGDKWARLEPYDGYKLDFSIEFDHPAIGRTASRATFDFAKDDYEMAVARARTFGFTHEVEYLRDNGLALGGGLENAIVLDEFRILNADGLRFADEFVRHKILDAIGDLALAGLPLKAAFSACKSGHALNNKLARALLENRQAWEHWTEA
jgi:UDP-3-O-[3-hydroxymyristoyl] N-acetylglucosamine deacetylase